METSFGIMNNTIYEITDWHQLLGINSDFKFIKCAVTTISDDYCDGVNITIYNCESNINYVTFFVVGSNSKQIDLQNIVLDNETAENLLLKFGYHIRFINHYNLTQATKDALTACLSLGFEFIHKFDIENRYIYVSKYNSNNIADFHKLNVKELPNSDLCDFSFLNFNDNLSISDILRDAKVI